VRNGSYPWWSIIRLITDASGPNKTNAQAVKKPAYSRSERYRWNGS
jgi:hypothetical protein